MVLIRPFLSQRNTFFQINLNRSKHNSTIKLSFDPIFELWIFSMEKVLKNLNTLLFQSRFYKIDFLTLAAIQFFMRNRFQFQIKFNKMNKEVYIILTILWGRLAVPRGWWWWWVTGGLSFVVHLRPDQQVVYIRSMEKRRGNVGYRLNRMRFNS